MKAMHRREPKRGKMGTGIALFIGKMRIQSMGLGFDHAFSYTKGDYEVMNETLKA